ncbi:hypothetical protein BDV59DRAFT_201406 [Aspergillus ambiguus]|uniref:uncharacterized protein n=1 Tax=Aspergillus ambiguus TaxID=176160 RepID=UPI003CCDAD62
MQLNSVLVSVIVALSSTAIALPMSSGKFHLEKIQVPGRRTSDNRNWPKIMSPNKSTNGTSHGPSNTDFRPEGVCSQLCAVSAQTCVVALPNDEDFCYDTYEQCTSRC